MENNMHLWEIHSSCSFFHIQEESFRSKMAKPQVQDIHIQRRSFKSDMENCTYERFTLLVGFHIPEGRSNRSEMAKPQVWDIQYSDIQEKEAFKSDMDNHKYEERFSSSCSFSHTGGSSFKYVMEKNCNYKEGSTFSCRFSDTAESSKSEMENHKYERIHIAFTFRRKLSHLKWKKSTAAFQTERDREKWQLCVKCSYASTRKPLSKKP